MTETLVVDGGIQTVAVYDGPRGLTGATGATGAAGADGQGISVKGNWNDITTYVPGDAVSSRSALNPGISSLWIVKDGQAPVVGLRPDEEPAKWIEVAAGDVAQQALGTTLPVNQVMHSFSTIGEPVAFSFSSGRYELADARDGDLLMVAVIADIPDADNILIQFGGRVLDVDPDLVADGPPDWQLGKIYYLSSSLGLYQLADPAIDGWYSQPAVTPINIDGGSGNADLVILTWGVSNYRRPVLTETQPAPVPQREGELWFRHADYPGLYVALEDAGASLKWVQANG